MSLLVALPLAPAPPAWVVDLVSQAPARFSLLSTNLVDATSLPAPAFAEAVADAYRDLGTKLKQRKQHPLRIWNFVPDIQATLGEGDRYMAFNAGRFAAYADWFGSPDAFNAILPTASAVGIAGDTLWIHTLAAHSPGTPVENPRQTPAYQYSRRYGLRPPCFARATKFEATLLIGGTASIVGEDSRHADKIETQTRETFQNIAALIASASQQAPDAALGTLMDLRVHVSDHRHAGAVRAILDEVAPAVRDVEFVEAKLCRKELLVEIEGRADCDGR